MSRRTCRAPWAIAVVALITVSATVAPSRAAISDSLDRANELYRQQRFDAARTAYERLLDRPDASRELAGVLHFNLGTVYLRMGVTGRSILHLEKARRRLGAHPRVRHNLEIARAQIDTPVPELPRPFWQRAAQTTVDDLGPRGLFYLGLGGYLILLGVGGALLLGRIPGRLGRWTAAAALIVALVGSGGGLWSSYERTRSQSGIVLEEQASLRSQPETGAAAIRPVADGVRVRIRETNGSWTRVRLPNGAEGWLSASAVEPI